MGLQQVTVGQRHFHKYYEPNDGLIHVCELAGPNGNHTQADVVGPYFDNSTALRGLRRMVAREAKQKKEVSSAR